MDQSWKNLDYLREGILSGDHLILARAITLVESANPADQKLSASLLSSLQTGSKNCRRLAISGSPGSGKSTFIEALGIHLLNSGNKVAVLAIDPSSQKTKGSILGDKTRMEQLGRMTNAFIRPSAAGNTLGGLAKATYASTILCEAAGFDYILIETVGVGQSEIAARYLSDFFILLLLPGAGDDLQGIKKGIMENIDLLFINKAENEQIAKARETQVSYKHALHMIPQRSDDWTVPVICGSALQNTGIDETIELIESFFAKNKSKIETNKRGQASYWFNYLFVEKLQSHFYNLPNTKVKIDELHLQLNQGTISAFEASEELFQKIVLNK
jgi:LAO/AO transport system kinase